MFQSLRISMYKKERAAQLKGWRGRTIRLPPPQILPSHSQQTPTLRALPNLQQPLHTQNPQPIRIENNLPTTSTRNPTQMIVSGSMGRSISKPSKVRKGSAKSEASKHPQIVELESPTVSDSVVVGPTTIESETVEQSCVIGDQSVYLIRHGNSCYVATPRVTWAPRL